MAFSMESMKRVRILMSVRLYKTVISTLNALICPVAISASVLITFTEMVQHASKAAVKILTAQQRSSASLQEDLIVSAKRDIIVMNQKSVSMSTSVETQMIVIRMLHAQTSREAIFASAIQVFMVLGFHASRANALMLLVPEIKHAFPQLPRVIVQRG